MAVGRSFQGRNRALRMAWTSPSSLSNGKGRALADAAFDQRCGGVNQSAAAATTRFLSSKNCSSSVECLSAVVDDALPCTVVVTVSK